MLKTLQHSTTVERVAYRNDRVRKLVNALDRLAGTLTTPDNIIYQCRVAAADPKF